MNLATALVLLVLAIAVFFAARVVYRSKGCIGCSCEGSSSCSGSCAACAHMAEELEKLEKLRPEIPVQDSAN